MTERFERELLRGSLDLMILSVLAEGAQYGYLIQKRLRQASGGRVAPQAGTLYPLLHKLEADRLIKSRWDADSGRRRKWYELTAAGRKELRLRAEAWRRYSTCVQDVLGAWGRLASDGG